MNVIENEFELTEILNRDIKQIHFVGIGGAGMSGIAEVLLNQGYQITGSDVAENRAVTYLKKLGILIYLEHQAGNIINADLVVSSSAIALDNPEINAAREANIRIVPRARMLAEIMRNRESVAIAGTHGKTTTTGLVASIFAEGKLDPTFVIGGLLHAAGTNAKIGRGDYFIAEADESDASFLYLHPKIAVVTNIDADHLWFYGNDFEKLKATFMRFINRIPPNGFAVVCTDDRVVRELLPQITCPVITYGFSAEANWQIVDFRQDGIQSHFEVKDNLKNKNYKFCLNLPGEHNALNATAAIIVALHANIAEHEINKALTEYKGTGRRFQIRGEYDFGKGRALIIDDYGHHPREIAATLKAIKAAWPQRRFVLAFQPQRYSRTQTLFNDFAKVLAEVDHLILLDIYPAGEKPIPGIDSASLGQAMQQYKDADRIFLSRNQKIEDVLSNYLRDGDILLMQGAGDVGAMAARLVP